MQSLFPPTLHPSSSPLRGREIKVPIFLEIITITFRMSCLAKQARVPQELVSKVGSRSVCVCLLHVDPKMTTTT